MTLAAGRAGAGTIRPPTDADERDDDRDARCVGRSPWIAPPTSGGELGRLGACGRPWLRRASCARSGRRPLRTERFRRVAVGGEWVGGDEADLDPGRRDALLLAGEEGDGPDVGDGGPALVQGPRPQAGVANRGDLGRVD